MITTTAPQAEIAESTTSTDSQLRADQVQTVSGERRVRSKLQSACLVLIAFLMGSHALYAAASVMVPIVAAIVIALALRPIVRKLKRMGVPEAAGAFLTVGLAVALFGFLASQLITPATEWISKTPISFRVRQLERKLEPLQGLLQSVQEASAQISEAVDDSTNGSSPTVTDDVPTAVIVQPRSLLSEVVDSTRQITAGAMLCLVLTFFFLAKGDTLIQRIGLLLPTPSSAENEACGVAAVERSVSRYLLTVSVINVCLGTCVGIACWLIGLPNAMLWGAMAAILNFLPYLGGLVGAGVVMLVSLWTFDSMTAYACLAPAVYLGLTAIEGNFVTPAVLGKSMSLNPLVVILSLTYWTWLWNFSGAILAVPLLAIFAAGFRQFAQTRPLAAILSD